MFNLDHLLRDRGTKALQAQNLVERAEKDEKGPRPMTAEELTLFDKLQEEVKSLDVQIAAIREHEKRREESQKVLDDLQKPTGRTTKPDEPSKPGTVANVGDFRIPASAKRTGKLKAFRGQDSQGRSAEYRAYRAGMWARATLFSDPRAQHWCLSNGVQLAPDVRNAMSTTSNPDGGFLVPDEMAEAIIDLREEYGVFRRECRVWPMGSDTLMIPRRSGGITIGAIGENPSSAISQSNPAFNQVQLVAKKAGGLTLISTEVAEDAVIDLADWIAQEFAYAFALYEDQCGFIGDGTSTYLGIRGLTNLLTEASSLAGAVAAATNTHDLFSEVDAADLAVVMGKLPQYAKPNAKWYCSSVANELVFGRLKASAGGNTVQTLNGEQGDNYMGYPIVVSQVLPSATTAIDALPMLFFGDLRKSSALGDRRQVRVFPSEHRYMDTDQIGIRGTERFDIVNHDVGDTSTPGPIVALIGSTS